jgi:hypothetical protein
MRATIKKVCRAWPLRPHCSRVKNKRRHSRLCLLLAPLLFGAHDCRVNRRH